MRQCGPEIVRCEPNFEACLQSGDFGAGGGGGTGGGLGTEPDPDGGAADEEIWVCLPGRLEGLDPSVFPRRRGEICDYSVDCDVGLVCVCRVGATCSGEGADGPTCEELCDPDVLSRCPDQRPCIDLGTGRGYCEPRSAG